ncbi:MAG: ABC transporter ATP-binding protein [Lachnospiraceae bacterium]|nr:ABC transporter ATP-binding protein [Lachnospiraceae bacterium]
MLKLMRYLKKSIVPIIAVFALLVLQAYCDLSLPSYTSDIVDVGIQQGGITEAAPEVMRESTYQSLRLFLNESEIKTVESSYQLYNKEELNEATYNKYVKKYPVLETENIHIRTDLTESELNQLEAAMTNAMMLVTMFSTDSDMTAALKAELIKNMPAGGESYSVLQIMEMMPKEQRQVLVDQILEQFSAMPESTLRQSAVAGVKAEYKAVGINTDQIQINYIILAGLKMLGLALVAMGATIIVGFIAAKVAAGFGRDVRSQVFKKVVNFSNNEFDKFSTASLITRSTNDIQQVQQLIFMVLRMILYAPILGLGGVFKVLNTNVSMAWIIALAVVLIMGVVGVLFAVAMPKFKSMQKLVDRLNLVTREILTGLSVIRAFSTERHEEKRFEKANRDLTKTSLFVNRVMTFMMPVMMFIMNGIMVLILWFGAKGIDNGNMQVGDMMAFMQYAMQIIMSFLMLTMISIMLPRAAVSAKRVSEVLDTEFSIQDAKEVKTFQESEKGLIQFEHVNFRYPGADEDVLHDITFTARPGETTAIIGSTGSGKSTLVNLIPRLYDITGGSIKIDGIPINEVSQHELRERIGYVPQKGILFSGTIDSNLRYGKEDATEAEIKRAARIAQAESFIEQKDDKYNEHIAQGGANVSGGQKQRLSIARAIAKNPDIYIFDDSFSALDYKTDVTLRKTLKQEIADSTMIIVAQRISTILHAEQILVLDEGKIVAKGTHHELMKSCEVYRQIAASQLSQAELEKEGADHE